MAVEQGSAIIIDPYKPSPLVKQRVPLPHASVRLMAGDGGDDFYYAGNLLDGDENTLSSLIQGYQDKGFSVQIGPAVFDLPDQRMVITDAGKGLFLRGPRNDAPTAPAQT